MPIDPDNVVPLDQTSPATWSCDISSVPRSRLDTAYVVASLAIQCLDYDDQTRILAMLDARFGEVVS